MSSNPFDSLQRAQSGQSVANYTAIIEGFAAKGIPADEIRPRENVLTYDAWQAKGRQVRRGEHGVRVVTFIHTTDKQTGETRKRPWSTRVFHVTQTDPIGEPKPQRFAPLNPGPGHTLTPMPDPRLEDQANAALANRTVVAAKYTPITRHQAETIMQKAFDNARSDAAIVAAAKGKALLELTTEECEAMIREMQRAKDSPVVAAEEMPAMLAAVAEEANTIDVTPVASPDTEYNPELAAERVAERRYTRRAEQLQETAQWYTMLPTADCERILGHLPGTKEYGQFKSWARLTQEAQDALHYARTLGPDATPRERVQAGQAVNMMDLLPGKIDARPRSSRVKTPAIDW